MGIFRSIDSWAFIVLAVASASRPLPELVRARRRGARFSAIPAWVWSGLFYSLTVLAIGVLSFQRSPGGTWLNWLLVPLLVATQASLAVPGIVSRRRDGVPWWRFWVHAIPSPSAAAGTTSPGPAITLDARTSGLIGRIEKAAFSTTRLSPGYDEEEVDVFLDKVIAVLSEGGQPDQAELHSAHFATTRLRPGYVMHDVDSFLHEIAQASLS